MINRLSFFLILIIFMAAPVIADDLKPLNEKEIKFVKAGDWYGTTELTEDDKKLLKAKEVIINSPAFKRQVRDYQYLQRYKQKKKERESFVPEPVIIKFDPSSESVCSISGNTINVTKGAIDQLNMGPIMAECAFDSLTHELGHGMQFETNGATVSQLKSGLKRLRRLEMSMAHNPDMVTTRVFAFSEGWADFMKGFYMDKKVSSRDFTKYGRDDEAYGLGKKKKERHLEDTEGFNTQILLALAKDKRINPDRQTAIKKYFKIMKKFKPDTLMSFLKHYQEKFPEDSWAIRDHLIRYSDEIMRDSLPETEKEKEIRIKEYEERMKKLKEKEKTEAEVEYNSVNDLMNRLKSN